MATDNLFDDCTGRKFSKTVQRSSADFKLSRGRLARKLSISDFRLDSDTAKIIRNFRIVPSFSPGVTPVKWPSLYASAHCRKPIVEQLKKPVY